MVIGATNFAPVAAATAATINGATLFALTCSSTLTILVTGGGGRYAMVIGVTNFVPVAAATETVITDATLFALTFGSTASGGKFMRQAALLFATVIPRHTLSVATHALAWFQLMAFTALSLIGGTRSKLVFAGTSICWIFLDTIRLKELAIAPKINRLAK